LSFLLLNFTKNIKKRQALTRIPFSFINLSPVLKRAYHAEYAAEQIYCQRNPINYPPRDMRSSGKRICGKCDTDQKSQLADQIQNTDDLRAENFAQNAAEQKHQGSKH